MTNNDEVQVTLAQLLAEVRSFGEQMRRAEQLTSQAANLYPVISSQRQQAYEQTKETFKGEYHRRRREPDPPPDYVARSSRNYSSQNASKRVSYDYDFVEQSRPKLLTFSGDSREYYHWEQNLEDCFAYYDLPRTKRVSKCLKLLTGEARKWWEEEEEDRCHYGEPPITSWTQLKRILREEFAPELQPLGQPLHPKEKKTTISSKPVCEPQGSIKQCNHGELREQDEKVHGKRNSKVDTFEPEKAQVKEVDKSGQDVETKDDHMKEDIGNIEEVTNYPEIGELLETRNVHGPLVEPEAFQDDNNSHTKCLDNAKVSELKLDNRFCTNVVSSSLVNRLQIVELPPHTLSQSSRQADEAENRNPNPILVPFSSYKPVCKVLCDETTKETDQLLFSNLWQSKPEVNDLKTQESRKQGRGKVILHLSSQNKLNCLIRKEHMLLTIFREKLFAVQERDFVNTIIKKEHEKNYGNAIQAVKKNAPQVPFTKPDPLRVILKPHKLFGVKLSKCRVHNAVGNSLSLEILNQLLIYVKGLTKFEKPESELARVSCVEATLLKQWLSVENSFEFELKHSYLKDNLIHLFLALEDVCFAGTRDLEDSLSKHRDEYHLKKEQEIISLSTSAKVWSAFSQSGFKGSMTIIMHLLLSLSVERGTGQNKRRNRQDNIKEGVPILTFTNPQSDSLKVVPKLHKLIGPTPTNSEERSYVSNSLSLDILDHLLVYVKGLLEIDKPESKIARTSCVEPILVMQWLKEEDSEFKKMLNCFCNLKNMLMRLFLVLEVECLSGTQNNVKDKPPDQGEYELESNMRAQEKHYLIIIDLTNGTVWKILLKSDHNFSTTTIIHLLLSLSVEQGTGLIKRYNGQRNIKDKPPDQRRYECKLEICTSVMVWSNLLESEPPFSMTTIKHLILFLSFEKGTGLTQRSIGPRNVKEKPPDRRAHKDTKQLGLECLTRKHEVGSSNQRPHLMRVKKFTSLEVASPSVFRLKEEPPDLPNSVSSRGKLLNPYAFQWTNLLYLCVGDQVLRTKPFEEGGYDEGMASLDIDQLEPEETQPEGPTEAAQDLPYPKENLPYLPMLGDYLAKITFGVTKEITASSQDPDQTSRRSRLSSKKPTRSYRGVTVEIYHLPYFHHILTMGRFLPPSYHNLATINTYHFYHHHITSQTPYITPPFIFHIHSTLITPRIHHHYHNSQRL